MPPPKPGAVAGDTELARAAATAGEAGSPPLSGACFAKGEEMPFPAGGATPPTPRPGIAAATNDAPCDSPPCDCQGLPRELQGSLADRTASVMSVVPSAP